MTPHGTVPSAVRKTRCAPSVTVLTVLAVTSIIAGGGLLGRAALGARAEEPQASRVGTEVPLTAMNYTSPTANNSPTLAVDPKDPRFTVLAHRVDGPDFSCALHVSGNGGRGWASSNPVPRLPADAEKCYAPEVAFDRNGVLYYLFAGLAGRGNEPIGVFLTTSRDRGRTFSTPRRVLGPLNFSVRMAIDVTMGKTGRLHLVWVKATSDPPLGGFGPPPNPILAMHSDDGGKTFSEPVQVSDPERERVVAPALALGPGDAVHVAYYDLKDDAVDYQGLAGPVWEETWSLVVATSRDGGRGFGRGVVAEASVVPPERVMLIFTMAPPGFVVNESELCLAWPDAREGDPDIFLRCSNGGGRKWSEARRLNDDPVGNGVSQLLPRLGVSDSGRLDAVFYDRRVEPGNFVNHVFLTFSTDRGRTWARNLRLTSHGSDSRIGQQYANESAQGLIEFGSRLAVLSRAKSAVAAWADTRNSRPQTFGQDVFATVVSLPGGERGSIGAVLGALLLGTGGTALALVAHRSARRRSGSSLNHPAEAAS